MTKEMLYQLEPLEAVQNRAQTCCNLQCLYLQRLLKTLKLYPQFTIFSSISQKSITFIIIYLSQFLLGFGVCEHSVFQTTNQSLA